MLNGQKIKQRSLAIETLRSYFSEQNFLEIDTPILQATNTTEPHIDPLMAIVNISPQQKIIRYLHTSPELSLKRVLSYGESRIYQLSHVFRDGEYGPMHVPEFSMAEWYRAHQTLNDLAEDCYQIINRIAQRLLGKQSIVLDGGNILRFDVPFETMSMHDAWMQFAKVDLRQALAEIEQGNRHALEQAVSRAGYFLRDGADFEDAFHHVMLMAIEPRIGRNRPCVINRWPRQLSMLSNVCDDDPLFAERFELYAGGLELANAYNELTDAQEQERRFELDNQTRLMMGKPQLPLSREFLNDLANMPPASGVALGFDRVLALVLQQKDLRNVQTIPWFE